jgi:hypothetical protein
MFLNDLAEFLYVIQETCISVWLSFNRNIQIVIMPVPVLIRTDAEHIIIPFFSPRGVVQFVSRIKMFHPGQVNHYKKMSRKVKLNQDFAPGISAD